MAFFRDFLIKNEQIPDMQYSERDEAALVLFLLRARLNRSTRGILIPEDFDAEDSQYVGMTTGATQKDLEFVSGFMCFFVSKATPFMNEIEEFKQYFIPQFASDQAKQKELAQALRPGFFTATLESLKTAQSIDSFCDPATLAKAAGA